MWSVLYFSGRSGLMQEPAKGRSSSSSKMYINAGQEDQMVSNLVSDKCIYTTCSVCSVTITNWKWVITYQIWVMAYCYRIWVMAYYGIWVWHIKWNMWVTYMAYMGYYIISCCCNRIGHWEVEKASQKLTTSHGLPFWVWNTFCNVPLFDTV